MLWSLPVLALLVVGLVVTAEYWVAWSITQGFRWAMDGTEKWSGSVGRVEFDPGSGRVSFSDLSIEGQWESLTLRKIEIPDGWVSLAPDATLSGRFPLRGVAIAPVVTAQKRSGPAKEPKGPGDSSLQAMLDVAIVHGTWVWTQEAFTHRVRAVNGTYTGIGNGPDAGHLDVLGVVGRGPVHASGPMDFWGTHGEAIDLTFEVVGVEKTAFQGAPHALLGLTIPEGAFDATARFTMDRGNPDLPDNPCRESTAIQKGCIDAQLIGRSIAVQGLVGRPIRVEELVVTLSGGVDADHTLRATLIAEGVELAVLRSEWTRSSSSPANTLSALGPFLLEHVIFSDAAITLVDDSREPPLAFGADAVSLHGVGLGTAAAGPGRIQVPHAEIAGGRFTGRGTLDLREWPPPTDLEGEVRGLQLARLHETVARFVDAGVTGGTADADLTLSVDGDGALDSSAIVTATDVVGRINGWSAEIGRLHGDVFGGWANADQVVLEALQQGDSAVERAIAPSIRVRWDAVRLLDEAHFDGSVALEQPEITFFRVGGPMGEVSRPDAHVTLDVKVTDGDVLVVDPLVSPRVELALEDVDLDVLGFSTWRRDARWEVEADVARGGHISGWAVMDPFRTLEHKDAHGVRARIEATDLQLDAFADLGRSYLDLPPIDGQADLELVLDDAGGSLEGHVRSIDIQSRSLTAHGERADIRLGWGLDAAPETRTLSGSLEDVVVRVRLDPPDREGASASNAGSARLDEAPRLPTLEVPALDVRNAKVVFETPEATVPIEDGVVELRDVTLGAHGETGDVRVHGKLWGGPLDGHLQLGEKAQTIDVGLSDARLVDINPFLRQWIGADVAAGTFSLDGHARLDPRHGLQGDAELVLVDPDVLQSEDWKRPLEGLKNAGIGMVVDFASRDGEVQLDIPIGGTPDDPNLGWASAVLVALLRP